MHKWVATKIPALSTFHRKDIIFGLLLHESSSAFLANALLLLGNFLFTNVKP